MRVLLTGASGFVGSHVLDHLRARDIPTAVLLRSTSDTRFLEPHLSAIEIRRGALDDPASLPAALQGITHVVHCAGCTKARRTGEFYAVNHRGTQNLVRAVNALAAPLERFLHVSTLAAGGPATPLRPAREDDPPHPVSAYGRSKLAGELEVRAHCRAPYTILRPPAVYGPRDYGFLSLFQAVKHHLRPHPSRAQALSLVFVRDLADAVAVCLTHSAAVGQTYYVAARDWVTSRQMAREVAAHMHRWTLPCPAPPALLWPICLANEMFSRLTGTATLLNLQKYAELRAPGWVCDSTKLRAEVGFECPTALGPGISQTLEWYQRAGWL